MTLITETPGPEYAWDYYDGETEVVTRGLAGGAIIRGGIIVKPHVQRFATDLQHALGVSNFGTYNGHSPPEGPTQAIDIFNADSQSGYELQDRICNFAIINQRKYGVRYCIRRTKIWNVERANEGWRQQGVTGNRTADHYDHVHVTFYARAEVEDDMFENRDRERLDQINEVLNNTEVGVLRRVADIQRALADVHTAMNERTREIMAYIDKKVGDGKTS